MTTLTLTEKIRAGISEADIKRWAIMAFLFLIPVSYSANLKDIRESQEIFFRVMAMAVVSLFWENMWLTLFMLYNFILFFWNGASVGTEYILNIFLGGCLFWVSKNYFSKNDFLKFRGTFIVLLLIDMAFTVLQRFHIDPLHTPMDNFRNLVPLANEYYVGVYAVKMAHGMAIALLMPVLMSFQFFYAIPFFYLLYLCRSVGAVLGGISAFLAYIYFKSKRLFIISLVLGIIGGGAYIFFEKKDDGKTFFDRFPAWFSFVHYGFANPMGSGPDSFRNFTIHKNYKFAMDAHFRQGLIVKQDDGRELFVYQGINGVFPDATKNPDMDIQNLSIDYKKIALWDNAHNEAIHMFFEYGIVGIFLAIGLLIEMAKLFKYAVKDKETVMLFSMLTAFFVCGITQFPFHLARIAYLFPVLLGAFYAKTVKKTNEVSYV